MSEVRLIAALCLALVCATPSDTTLAVLVLAREPDGAAE